MDQVLFSAWKALPNRSSLSIERMVTVKLSSFLVGLPAVDPLIGLAEGTNVSLHIPHKVIHDSLLVVTCMETNRAQDTVRTPLPVPDPGMCCQSCSCLAPLPDGKCPVRGCTATYSNPATCD